MLGVAFNLFINVVSGMGRDVLHVGCNVTELEEDVTFL